MIFFSFSFSSREAGGQGVAKGGRQASLCGHHLYKLCRDKRGKGGSETKSRSAIKKKKKRDKASDDQLMESSNASLIEIPHTKV